MTQEPSTIAVAAPPIETLKELRRQNSALLQRNVAGTGTAKPTTGELLGFLESASCLGYSLKDPDERDVAQGIMDVWIAALLSRDPRAGKGGQAFTLKALDPARADLAADDARKLRADASAAAKRAANVLPPRPELVSLTKRSLTKVIEFFPSWTQPILQRITHQDRDNDAEVAQNLLLRFVRLKEKSLEAYAVPVSGEDDIFRDARATMLLEKLMEAGLVKRQETPGNEPYAYVLAHESLITTWPVLDACVKQRKAFRELARGWENGGRQPSALLNSGEQLQAAFEFPHLDASEEAFREASRHSNDRSRNRNFSLAVTTVGVLLIMVISLYNTNGDLKNAQAKIAHELAISRTAASAILSLRDLLARRTPAATATARDTSAITAEVFRKSIKPVPGRQSIEVFIDTDCDLLGVANVVEFLRDKGYETVAGTALPRAGLHEPSVVRPFYRADIEKAQELADILAPVLADVMPIENVTHLLVDEIGAQARDMSVPAKRAMLKTPKFRDKLIELDPPKSKEDEDENAPEGFLQVEIEAKALRVVPP